MRNIMESTGGDNARNIGLTVIIIIVIILALSTALLQMSRNAEPPVNDVTMDILTSHTSGNVWYGSVSVSSPGRLISVIIPTETIEISGQSSLVNLIQGTNTLEVTFDGLESGVYVMIFTFQADGSDQAFSEEIFDVEFTN